jgi:hypothetical protein
MTYIIMDEVLAEARDPAPKASLAPCVPPAPPR